MTTFTGSNTAIYRGAFNFKSSRIQNSNKPTSTRLSALATPMRSQKSRIDSGVYPRRRKPEIVGIRGSSQPLTRFNSTNWRNLRLLMTIFVTFKRANSICFGFSVSSQSSNTQLYSGRCTSNSNVHTEWVMRSIASDTGCA